MSQKKVVGRNVAIALGIICVVLASAMIGTFTQYSSTISEMDKKIENQNSKIQKLEVNLSQTQGLLSQTQASLNQTQTWLKDNITAFNQLLESQSGSTTASYVVLQKGNYYSAESANGAIQKNSSDASALD